MMRLHKTTRVLAGLAFALLMLAACNTTTPVVAPATPDLGVVRTEAVQTAVAKITIAAALNPTATEAPTQAPQVVVITATPEPTTAATATQAAQPAAPTTAPTQAPAASSGSGSTSGGSSSGGAYPTLTPRRIPDNLTLVSSSPLDGTTFTPGNKFDGVWKVKNTGTTTWGTDYYLRFKSGTDMGEAVRFYLKQPVKPGETVDLVADLVAPSESGRYTAYYEFCTPNADIIYTMYVMIVVP